MDLKFPAPKIVARKPDQALQTRGIAFGLDPILARILASRPQPQGVDMAALLNPSLAKLAHPGVMADMARAADRVAEAIVKQQCIGLETDHDCDGQTSHAVLYHNLVHHFNHPKDKIRSYIGHRLNEGYGLSESVANRILADDPPPQLVITADNGSSDEPRIARLKEQNIDVIVTDHHQLPTDGIPKSAYACLNPTRPDCAYPDHYIAGCMVAWLLMTVTRQLLCDRGVLPADAPKLLDSLDFVAVGTVADCVSLARSYNNRAIVRYGLRLINAAVKPCWAVLLQASRGQMTSEDLGFQVGPLLNSDGRLACAMGSVSFLLAEDRSDAQAWLEHLQAQNKQRKQLQRQLVQAGLKLAAQQFQQGRFGLCIYLPEGHPGVHGICASRVKECYGRPTVFLAPKLGETGILTGSARGIDTFNVKQAFDAIAQAHPDLLLSYGGHTGAGGLSIAQQHHDQFANAWDEAAKAQLASEAVGPIVWTDGELTTTVSLELAQLLATLEPYGREFEPPMFECQGAVTVLKWVGDETHARLTIAAEKLGNLSGIWFNARANADAAPPIQLGDRVHAVFSLKQSEFRGVVRCDVVFQVVKQQA